MSILDDKKAYEAALEQAHKDFPPKDHYDVSPDECNHNYSFIVFCDGNDYDIARCPKCGDEKVVRCTFDDDYD